MVILAPHQRSTIGDVGLVPLRNRAGTYVCLHQLADIYETSGRYVMLHEGARRVQTVTCNVAGRDRNAFVADAQKTLRASVELPPGTSMPSSPTLKRRCVPLSSFPLEPMSRLVVPPRRRPNLGATCWCTPPWPVWGSLCCWRWCWRMSATCC